MQVKEILAFLDEKKILYELLGEGNFTIDRFCVPQNLVDNSLIWVKKKDGVDWNIIDAHKNVLIVTSEELEENSEKAILKVDHSKAVFFTILDFFFETQKEKIIDSSARVLTKTIGKNVSIGFNSFIGPDVELGDNVTIGNNVSIENKVIIGDNTTIFSGTVLGVDGFGFFRDEAGNNTRVPHYGRVVIGHDVEIGANCVINRGTLGDTVIGDFTKIDSANHIPHNVIIGNNCLLTSGSQLCGSCEIGEGSYLAPTSCIKNQIHIGKNCMINMGTVITEDLPDGVVAQGKRRIKIDYKQILNM